MIEALFFSEAEVVAGEGCRMPRTWQGAAVNCYTFASSEAEARKKVCRALEDDRYVIAKLTECYEIGMEGVGDCGELEDANLTTLRQANGVFYGPFYGWIEDPMI